MAKRTIKIERGSDEVSIRLGSNLQACVRVIFYRVPWWGVTISSNRPVKAVKTPYGKIGGIRTRIADVGCYVGPSGFALSLRFFTA